MRGFVLIGKGAFDNTNFSKQHYKKSYCSQSTPTITLSYKSTPTLATTIAIHYSIRTQLMTDNDLDFLM